MTPSSVKHIRDGQRSLVVKVVGGATCITCITRYGDQMYNGIVEQLQEIPSKPGTFCLTSRNCSGSVPITDVLRRNRLYPVNKNYNLGTL